MVDVLGPDDIPAIRSPSFENVGDAASWLGPDAPVIVVRDGASARAYPLAILEYHEVVNDTVAGIPVAVTYSPIANAAVVFERFVRDLTLTFGTSGKVYQSDLVLYDRESHSLWPQMIGVAAAGDLKGASLTVVPSQITSFRDFTDSFPSGSVLKRPGSATYEFTPYPGYDSRTGPYDGYFFGRLDARLPAMARVVGVVDAGEPRSYAYPSLASHGNPSIANGIDYVVFWGGSARSPLNTVRMSEGRVVGSSGVFVPRAAGRALHFVARDGKVTDNETHSVWSLDGRALSGPLKGAELPIYPHVDTFWFVWAAFHPRTGIF